MGILLILYKIDGQNVIIFEQKTDWIKGYIQEKYFNYYNKKNDKKHLSNSDCLKSI
jgi:hypothetical protein